MTLSGEAAGKGLLLRTKETGPEEPRELDSPKLSTGCAFFLGFGEGRVCGVIAIKPPDRTTESNDDWWCLKFTRNVEKDKMNAPFCFAKLSECDEATLRTGARYEEDQLETTCVK